jgi:DNA-binding GntR family transcriptional regulator
VAYLDDVPITILVAYIRVNPYGAENLLQFSGGSLHAFLKQAFDIEFVRARKYVEVIFSDDFESQLLSVSRGAPLLQVISISFDTGDRPVEYSKLINPGARFRLWFDGYIRQDGDQ